MTTCAVLYDAEFTWATSDYYDNKDICKALYDNRLDYDIIPWDRLADMNDNGEIFGEKYPVILVPYSAYISDEQRNLLARHSGRTVVIGENKIEGFAHVTPENLVGFMEKYRDVSIENGGKLVRYYHYEKGERACYMFSNEEAIKTYEVTVKMRGFSGGSYVVYDSFENKAVRRYSKNGSIPLTLAPYNMLCVIIGDDAELGDGSFIFEAKEGETRPLSPTWEISVCEEKQMPAYRHYKTTAELENITGPDALHSFSGNIRYTASVKLERKKEMILDLGEVGSTAEVSLNGKSVGVRVYPPYRFDISDAVIDGDNSLEITVTNTCVFAERDNFSRYLPIRASGIMGPISLTASDK